MFLLMHSTILPSVRSNAERSEDKAFIVATPFTHSTRADCLSASLTESARIFLWNGFTKIAATTADATTGIIETNSSPEPNINRKIPPIISMHESITTERVVEETACRIVCVSPILEIISPVFRLVKNSIGSRSICRK